MWNPNTQAYLSDDLERKLLQQAIEEEARFKPINAVKNLVVKLFRKS